MKTLQLNREDAQSFQVLSTLLVIYVNLSDWLCVFCLFCFFASSSPLLTFVHIRPALSRSARDVCHCSVSSPSDGISSWSIVIIVFDWHQGACWFVWSTHDSTRIPTVWLITHLIQMWICVDTGQSKWLLTILNLNRFDCCLFWKCKRGYREQPSDGKRWI